MLILFVSCQNNKSKNFGQTNSLNESTVDAQIKTLDEQSKKFRDSLYRCECDVYNSKLKEVSNKDSKAYSLTIKSKQGNWEKHILIDTRPKMSRINGCNEFYTIVSFPCGGPCHSELFVFTNDHRPNEQYSYTQVAKNDPHIISYIKNEDFETTILRNLSTGKELQLKLPNSNVYNYGQADSMLVNKDRLSLYYKTNDLKTITKTVSLTHIMH